MQKLMVKFIYYKYINYNSKNAKAILHSSQKNI